MSRIAVAAALAAVTLVPIGVVLLQAPSGAEAQAPVAVSRAALGVGALGRIEPRSRVRKLSHGAGPEGARMARLMVAEGDRVEAGQVLAEFHDAAAKDAAAVEAEAKARESEARLARVQAAARAEEITAQRARIRAVEAEIGNARKEAERARSLLRGSVGTEATYDRAKSLADKLDAQRLAEIATLATLVAPRPEDLAVARAEAEAARAASERAAADARLTRLVAPIAGTVLRIYARPGERIPDEGVLELADLSELDVVAEVYETDLPRIRPGATAEVIVPGEKRRFTATVRDIGWMVRRNNVVGTDPVTAVDARTVEVRLALDADGVAALARRSNMQVQVQIAGGSPGS